MISKPMRIPNDYYMIVDLEATCCNDGTFPRSEMEIIEIGAVMMDARNFEIKEEFQTFAKPVQHPVLTSFCRELTGIRQDQVEGAPPFGTALVRMKAWAEPFPDLLFCSWGDYDRKQFIQDCTFQKIEYPWGSGHMNLKAEFTRALGLKKPLGIAGALRRCGLEFEGSQHRGLDDAKNIARIVRRVLAR